MGHEPTVTQEELNGLFASLAAGERRAGRGREGRPAVHEARVHDFARSEGLARATVQLLEHLHRGFARGVGLSPSPYLRDAVQVSLLSLDQLSYHQYLHSISDPTALAVIALPPLPGQALLEINLALAYWMIDRLLGGQGEIPKAPRELTPVECAILQGPLERMLAELSAAWEEYLPLRPELISVASSPTAVAIAKPTDGVAAAFFEVSIGSLSSMASLCLPAIALKLARVGADGGAGPASAEAHGAEPPRRRLEVALRGVPLECALSLGEAALSAAEISELRPGDVIVLDRGPGDGAELLVSGWPAFRCRPRAEGRRLAAEVVAPMQQDRPEVG